MKTIVLDGYALNPGDLSWSWLSEAGEYKIYNNTLPSQVIERAKDAELIITNKAVFTKEVINSLPKLKYIGVTATGYNIIDTVYAAEKEICVTNAPAYSTESVAQHTFALLFELMAHTGLHNDSVKAGEWASSEHFCYWKKPVFEISGKTMGLIGCGQIGQRVAEIAKAFGMNVLISAKSPKPGRVPFEEVLKNSDIISIHCPQTAETTGLINKQTIAKMRDGVYLINTARGGIVNEEDTAEALKTGKVAGFACDVLSEEPPKADNPIIHAPNTIITPHIAWASLDARKRLMDITKNNLLSFLDGNPNNRVN